MVGNNFVQRVDGPSANLMVDPKRVTVLGNVTFGPVVVNARLRNLPFTEPAPLEDLPELPSTQAARIMHALDDEGYDAP